MTKTILMQIPWKVFLQKNTQKSPYFEKENLEFARFR
jgi:hypothetical protein